MANKPINITNATTWIFTENKTKHFYYIFLTNIKLTVYFFTEQQLDTNITWLYISSARKYYVTSLYYCVCTTVNNSQGVYRTQLATAGTHLSYPMLHPATVTFELW